MRLVTQEKFIPVQREKRKIDNIDNIDQDEMLGSE
tara:strand:+ start:3442 stop:3546 length:105 start_codon:yes stop_codon:yes gene_type:complete